MASAAGIQFGNYRLIERLAHGGMAEVFLARQQGPEGFDRRVAIKRILPHLADSQDFMRMFLVEARLAASLSHPNVVHIYELGKVGDHYFLAMEYIDGVHAGAVIERGGRERLPAALVARIGADACAGLNYVHNAVDSSGRPLHLVHRDISPPNLMISYDGVVKLMDFGIAKAVGQVDQTRPGIVKGKFAYMSPEQTTGETLDGRSDVFSLSLVLWELLAGRVALPRTDPVEAMTMIRDGKIPSLRQVRPDVPRALAAVLEQGLRVDREHRASAADLGAALEGFIKSSPELGTGMQLSEWVRRRFPRRMSLGEPVLSKEPDTESGVAPGAGPEPRTDIAPELGFGHDAQWGTEPSLEALSPITGEVVSPSQGYAGAGEPFPAEISDEASAPATTPSAAPLPEAGPRVGVDQGSTQGVTQRASRDSQPLSHRTSQPLPRMDGQGMSPRASQPLPRMDSQGVSPRASQPLPRMDSQGVSPRASQPLPQIDPARSFLEEDAEEEDATEVSEPPRPATGEPLFAATTPFVPFMRPDDAPSSKARLTAVIPQRASARPRRTLPILAATLLVAVVIGFVVWTLIMRAGGLMDLDLGFDLGLGLGLGLRLGRGAGGGARPRRHGRDARTANTQSLVETLRSSG